MNADTICKNLENIHVGMKVLIQRKRIEKVVEGVITHILDDRSFNPLGIEVEINGYLTGNVKKIIKPNDEFTKEEILNKIQSHESKYFELKSSFKYDLNLSNRLGSPQSNERLKRKIVEEAASFMNTSGGIICLGVNDEKNILGLEYEYKLQSDYSPAKDRSLLKDKLRLEIKSTLKKYLDDELIYGLFEIQIIEMEPNKEVCCIILKKSPEPIFVKHKNITCRIDNKDTKVDIWKCWIRSDNGIESVEFDSFMKLWKNRK